MRNNNHSKITLTLAVLWVEFLTLLPSEFIQYPPYIHYYDTEISTYISNYDIYLTSCLLYDYVQLIRKRMLNTFNIS